MDDAGSKHTALDGLVKEEGLWYKGLGYLSARGPSMPTVLIVDDEENLRELYRTELTEEGYEVLTAANGKEAMELLQGRRPDAVVMDIRMPEMDGIEALGKMVARYKGLPVIINTAYSRYQDDFRSWAAEAYVVKSSDLSELRKTLRKVIEKARKAQ